MASCRLNKTGWFILAVVCLFVILHYLPSAQIERIHGNPISVRSLIQHCILLAEDAGNLVRSQYDPSQLHERIKSAGSGPANEMLTNLDLLSNQFIVSNLISVHPGLNVRSEEKLNPANNRIWSSVIESYNKTTILDPQHTERIPFSDFLLDPADLAVWVDPLDATQELVEGFLDYVSIMMCITWRGQALAGVIHQPFLNRTYWAWQQSKSQDLAAAAAERARASSSGGGGRLPLRVTVSRSHTSPEMTAKLQAAFSTLNKTGSEVKLLLAGGSGYKFISLINGDADLYVHAAGTRRFDICAGQALLESTGGQTTGLDGTRLTYWASADERIPPRVGVLAAATSDLHKAWIEHFQFNVFA